MSQKKPQATIKDVARRAGCSVAVVSTVVNGARGNTAVGADTRQRVLEAAQALNYRRHFASRSLVHGRTGTLGLYIPPLPWAGPGFTYDDAILRGVEAGCLATGHDLLLINLAGGRTPDACLDKFAERRIDGLLLVHVEAGSRWIRDLLAGGGPVIAVDYPLPEPRLHAVVFDNVAAGRLAVEHLYAMGHRRIGFMASCLQPTNVDGALRLQGYLQAMSAHRLSVPLEWIFDRSKLGQALERGDAVCQIEGRAAARYILSLADRAPTAWIAYSDLVAASALPVLQACGVRVPTQVSVMGVDDAEHARLSQPTLTTIRHPLEEMGRRAVELLVERIAEPPPVGRRAAAAHHELFPPELIVRESTARPFAFARE
jgi:LacI family transcriptional regulator